MEETTKERTHSYRREQTIECSNWLDFEIIEVTMRGFSIRFREKVDIPSDESVQFGEQPE